MVPGMASHGSVRDVLGNGVKCTTESTLVRVKAGQHPAQSLAAKRRESGVYESLYIGETENMNCFYALLPERTCDG